MRLWRGSVRAACLIAAVVYSGSGFVRQLFLFPPPFCNLAGWVVRRRRLASRLRRDLLALPACDRKAVIAQLAGTTSSSEREFLALALRDPGEPRELVPAATPAGRGNEPAAE